MSQAIFDLLVDRLQGMMPRVAIVLGSGLGSLVEELTDAVRIPFSEVVERFRRAPHYILDSKKI